MTENQIGTHVVKLRLRHRKDPDQSARADKRVPVTDVVRP
jgi:hypothetical protein